MKSEFGNPSDADWHQQNLGDCVGILESLVEREVERAEKRNAKLFGDGLINVRLELVDKARELLEVADNGNPKIMREMWKKIKINL